MAFSILVLDSISFSFNSVAASGSNKYREQSVLLCCELRKGDSCFPCSSLLEKARQVCGKQQKALSIHSTAKPSSDVVVSARIPEHTAGLWPSCSCQELLWGLQKGKCVFAKPGVRACGAGEWVGVGTGVGTCPASAGQAGGCWSPAAGRVVLCQRTVRSSRRRQLELLVIRPNRGITVPAICDCNSGETSLSSKMWMCRE